MTWQVIGVIYDVGNISLHHTINFHTEKHVLKNGWQKIPKIKDNIH